MKIEIMGVYIVESEVKAPIFIPEKNVLQLPHKWIDTLWLMTTEQYIKNNLFYCNDFILLAQDGNIVLTTAKRDMKDSPIEHIAEIRIET